MDRGKRRWWGLALTRGFCLGKSLDGCLGGMGGVGACRIRLSPGAAHAEYFFKADFLEVVVVHVYSIYKIKTPRPWFPGRGVQMCPRLIQLKDLDDKSSRRRFYLDFITNFVVE